MNDSAVAVLTYNRKNTLEACLNGLIAHCDKHPIAVFDDKSVDLTPTYLRKLVAATGQVEVIERPELLCLELRARGGMLRVFLGDKNLGVAGNTNRAIRWFMDDTKAAHLCVMNDDLTVHGDFATFYREAHEDTRIHLFCFCDFTSEQYRWTTAPVKTKRRTYELKMLPRMTGIMMSFTRPLVERIGYFDVEFGPFGEEHSVVGTTWVTMGDGSTKQIAEVREEDVVLGWNRFNKGFEPSKVTITKSYEAPVVKVKTTSGKMVTCTRDHLWVVDTTSLGFGIAKEGRKMVEVAYRGDEWKTTESKVASIEDAGKSTVFCLTTDTGTYVAGGLLSKNCDFTNRARFTGGMKLKEYLLHCVDIDTGTPPLLKHQDAETSISGEFRQQCDQIAYSAMQKASRNYGTRDWYRPFALLPPIPAGVESSGIDSREMRDYPMRVDPVTA